MKSVDLLPPELRPVPVVNKDSVLLASVLLTVAMILARSFINNQQMNSSERRLSSLNSQLTKVEASLLSLTENHTKTTHDMEIFKQFAVARENLSRWSDAFKELSILIPQDTWLTSINNTTANESYHLVITGETSSQIKVKDFFTKLESSYHFNDLSMTFSEKIEGYRPSLYRFQFESKIEKNGASL